MVAKTESGSMLNEKERLIVKALQKGLSNKQIARHTGIPFKTVETYLYRLYKHFNVNNRIQLICIFGGTNAKTKTIDFHDNKSDSGDTATG